MKEAILEFAQAHWEHFGVWPDEVELDDGQVLTWDEYLSILEGEEV